MKVLNKEYEVKFVKSEIRNAKGELGFCYSDKHVIEVHTLDSNVLIHEMVHAYLNEMGHQDENGIHNEVNVTIIECVINNMVLDGNLSLLTKLGEE